MVLSDKHNHQKDTHPMFSLLIYLIIRTTEWIKDHITVNSQIQLTEPEVHESDKRGVPL